MVTLRLSLIFYVLILFLIPLQMILYLNKFCIEFKMILHQKHIRNSLLSEYRKALQQPKLQVIFVLSMEMKIYVSGHNNDRFASFDGDMFSRIFHSIWTTVLSLLRFCKP